MTERAGPPTFSPDEAILAVRDYNRGSYRGRRNVDVDRVAYDRFRGGIPDDTNALVDLIRFVGED